MSSLLYIFALEASQLRWVLSCDVWVSPSKHHFILYSEVTRDIYDVHLSTFFVYVTKTDEFLTRLSFMQTLWTGG